jgi:hypothetical protein
MQNVGFQGPLSKLFASQKIDDVLVTGFVEREGSRQMFHPMLWWVYVKFESCYLRCYSENQWFLRLDIVNDVGREFDVGDNEFCMASIRDVIVFNSHVSQKVAAFGCLLDKDCNSEGRKIKAGGFYLQNGETIFFDPSSNEGIRIGSKEQVYRWTSQLHYPMASYKEEKWEFPSAHVHPIGRSSA